MRSLVFMAALVVGLGTSFEAPNVLPMLDHALRRFSDASTTLIARSFTPVIAKTEPIDAKAAANLDEDLDWRIADQTKTAEGWRAFLAVHPNGAHASVAKTALGKLTRPDNQPVTPPPPAPKFAPVVTPPPPAPKFAPVVTPPPPAPKFAPVIEIANAPPTPTEPDVFAALERLPPPTKTIVKWREPRTVTRYLYERPRYRRRPPPMPFFAWFGPRDPRDPRP